MNYDELKTNIIQKYNGIDNIPDDVYNAMKAYQAKGNSALDDDKVYNILKGETTKEPATDTQSGSFGGFDSLYSKALQYGYSGLSDDEKAKLDFEYSKSNAAKTKSLDQVHTEMDANAKISQQMAEPGKQEWESEHLPNTAQKLYQGAREIVGKVSNIIPATAAAVMGSEYKLDPATGLAVKDPENQTAVQRFKNEYNASTEDVKKGEGLASVLADPMNVVGGIVGSVTKIPKVMSYVDKIPAISTVSELASKYPKTSEAITGGTLGTLGSYLGKGENDDHRFSMNDVASGLMAGAINPIIQQSRLNPKSSKELSKLEQEAIKSFPGTRYFNTQANKAGLHGEESIANLDDETKKAILKEIASGKGEGNIDDWIDYQRGQFAKAKEGYENADDKVIEQLFNLSEGTPFVYRSELRESMLDKIKGLKGVSQEDAEKFVDSKLKSWEEKDGSILLSQMGEYKGMLSDDIFDPRFTISEGTTQKRKMAQRAGKAIDEELEKKVLNNGTQSYNDIVGEEAKKAYRTGAVLSDIFAHQGIPTGTQRTGAKDGILKSLYNEFFPGGRKVYSSTGDAYAEPIAKFRAAQREHKVLAPIIGGVLGSFGLNPNMIIDLPYQAGKGYMNQQYLKNKYKEQEKKRNN